MNNDWKTPEFWTMAIVNIVTAIVAILATRGLLTADEGELWIQLIEALATPIALIIIGMTTKEYLSGQTKVREARIMQGFRE